MEHVAITNKKDKNWLQLIVDGRKTIESRWYKNRYAPWNGIKSGEIVYFKNSGEPVSVKSIVGKIMQFRNLTEDIIRDIYNKYGKAIGLEKNEFERAVINNKNKKYCILIFLKTTQKIKPFNISKKGFGMMSAWITVDDVEKIKI